MAAGPVWSQSLLRHAHTHTHTHTIETMTDLWLASTPMVRPEKMPHSYKVHHLGWSCGYRRRRTNGRFKVHFLGF